MSDYVSCENCDSLYDEDDMTVQHDVLDFTLTKIPMYFCPVCVEESNV